MKLVCCVHQARPAKSVFAVCSLSSERRKSRKRVLFISPVWPEPNSSAAGVRTATLMQTLHAANWEIFYLSTSKANIYTERIKQEGCTVFSCPPNEEIRLAEAIELSQPDVCIFDRFIAEEAFSFRVRQLVPEALRVLDLQDLHSLRRAREAKFRLEGGWANLVSYAPMQTKDLLRELASIHRSDLVLVCSPSELQLLSGKYQISEEKLQLAPVFFTCEHLGFNKSRKFSERHHLMTIGNFRHGPNADSVKWLAEELWPLMRRRLPDNAELHCFGAYGTAASIRQLHNPGRGFHIKGHADSLDIMHGYRLCLAPLRYGAGLKGKIVDSWVHGLPVITTPIGAEGMVQNESEEGLYGSFVAETASTFVDLAVETYSDEARWTAMAAAGEGLAHELFDAEVTIPPVMDAIEASMANIRHLRDANLVGRMLWLQNNRATEFFSRWIELKEGIAKDK